MEIDHRDKIGIASGKNIGPTSHISGEHQDKIGQDHQADPCEVSPLPDESMLSRYSVKLARWLRPIAPPDFFPMKYFYSVVYDIVMLTPNSVSMVPQWYPKAIARQKTQPNSIPICVKLARCFCPMLSRFHPDDFFNSMVYDIGILTPSSVSMVSQWYPKAIVRHKTHPNSNPICVKLARCFCPILSRF